MPFGKGFGEKGKGKGKDGSKGKGKGRKGKGPCFNCGQPGHIARDCPDSNPYQGQCTNCGNWGHTAKYCKHNLDVQDVSEDMEPHQHGDVGGDRPLQEAALGGLELGGSVWALDRDKDGPWTLVQWPRTDAFPWM